MRISKKKLKVFGLCPKPYIVQDNLTEIYQSALAAALARRMDEKFLLGHCHKTLSQEEWAIMKIKQEVNAIFEEKKRVKRVLAALRSGRC